MHKNKKTELTTKIIRSCMLFLVAYSPQALPNDTPVTPIVGPWQYYLHHYSRYAFYAVRSCSVWTLGEWAGLNSGGCINEQDPFPWATELKLLPKAVAFNGDSSGTFHGWLQIGEKQEVISGYNIGPPIYRLGVQIRNWALITTPSWRYSAERRREYSCPPWSERHNNDYCLAYSEKNLGKACSVGNPINPATGNKLQHEDDIIKSRYFGLEFSRYYNSQSPVLGVIGYGWTHEYERKLDIDAGKIKAIRDDGKILSFTPVSGQSNAFQVDPDVTLVLTSSQNQSGGISGYEMHSIDGLVEGYDAGGKLTTLTDKEGRQKTLHYDISTTNGGDDNSYTLDRITGPYGEQLNFKYDINGHLIEVGGSDGYIVQYSYDQNNLIKVIYPDQTLGDSSDNPYKEYHYTQIDSYRLLSGITDENGNRYATWTYDSEGRAISSEHAGGVDKTTLAYNADGTTTVTNPLGKQTTYHFITIHGVKNVTQVEGHPTASCEGANKSYSYDVNGNVISKTDWNGVTTNYTYDMARNLELTRTEAAGAPQERIITTEWHTQFRLPTKITEPNRIIEYSYDALGRQLSRNIKSVQ